MSAYIILLPVWAVIATLYFVSTNFPAAYNAAACCYFCFVLHIYEIRERRAQNETNNPRSSVD